MAVAVPEPALARTRAIAQAAGLTIERIGLRASGSTALVASLDAGDEGALLVVDVTPGGVEFCVLGTRRSASPGRPPSRRRRRRSTPATGPR